MTRKRLFAIGVWVLVPTALATALFESASFALAHANLVVLAIYLPYWPAAQGLLPRMDSLPIVFLYEGLYFLLIALVVLGAKALFGRKGSHRHANAS